MVYSNKEKYTMTKRRKKALVKNVVRLVKQLTPCVDCGKNYHYEVMEFDHVRGAKINAVSQLVIRSYSLATIFTEIEKCDLVCANCHRLRTALRRNGTLEYNIPSVEDLRRDADKARLKTGLSKLEELLGAYTNSNTVGIN